MENTIYAGLSRAVALQRDMDTVSNNIANMNTPGFRGLYMMFDEYIEKPKGIYDQLSMVLDYGQYMSTKPGTIKMTGNPLDVAIQGAGFFSVQRGDEILYTRAGNFQRDVTGRLVTAEGYPVLSAGGGPIVLPEDSTEIRISENGTISNQGGEINQLAVTEFENINTLEAAGDALYRAGENANGVPSPESRIVQGAIEGSNVNPISEMTRMIDTHRAYQSVQLMLFTEHERQRTMIQRLTRIG
jgi:flagellar basal-body rod protein FlgF